jgi:UDP-GlcNAc:undecaprenyl-phosphate GlcNAc-1-phosphate transferase
VSCGVRLPIFGNAVDAAATVLWIVVLTNSFNLLDNMDGAAAAVGSATAAVLAVSAAAAGRPDVAALLFALSAGCMGFLIHNWAPARIFMGDAGSLFLGFVIATTAVAVHTSRTGAPTLTAVWLVTFIPTLDTAVVLISRHRAGRPLLTGGTDHVSHRLRRLGLSVPQVGLSLFALAVATSLTAMLVGRGLLPPVDVLLAGAVSAAAMTWALLRVPGYPKATRRRSALHPARADADAGPPEPKQPTRA